MDPQAARRCHALIGLSLVILTVTIGYCVVVGTCLADFVGIAAGLTLAWISFFYCLWHAWFEE